MYQIQDRTQTWLDLNRADAGTGAPRHILRETSKAWVERWQDASVDPIWLKDGSFLWLSERSGWRHFYHYAADGTLIRQVTQGEWEIRRTHGVDPAGTWVYFTSTTHSPIGLDLYRVRLDGTEPAARLDDRRTPSGVRQSLAHAVSRFVERRHDAAAGPAARTTTHADWSASSTRTLFRR